MSTAPPQHRPRCLHRAHLDRSRSGRVVLGRHARLHVITAGPTRDRAGYLRGTKRPRIQPRVRGPEPAAACLAFPCAGPADLDLAEQLVRRARLPRRAPARRDHAWIGEAVRVEDPLGFTRRVLPRHRAHRAAAAALRPAPRRRHRPHRPLQHLRPDDRRGPTTSTCRSASVCSETIRGQRHDVRGRGCYRKPSVHDIALTGGAEPACSAPRGYFAPEHHHIIRLLRHVRRHRRAGPHRARARAARRVERLLRVPARPRRTPPRGVHQRLLHRRPRPPLSWDVNDVRRARLLGRRRGAELVRRGDPVLDLRSGQPPQ